MYHNWIEIRAYMADRQEELLREAEAARRAAVSRGDRRALRRRRREAGSIPLIRPEVQEGGAS